MSASRVLIEFSDPEQGVHNLSLSFEDLPRLTREQRDAIWAAFGVVLRSFTESASRPEGSEKGTS